MMLEEGKLRDYLRSLDKERVIDLLVAAKKRAESVAARGEGTFELGRTLGAMEGRARAIGEVVRAVEDARAECIAAFDGHHPERKAAVAESFGRIEVRLDAIARKAPVDGG